MALLINIDGSALEVDPQNGEAFSLYEMYKHLDCRTVEFVYLENDDIMIIDEEGKLRDDWAQRINIHATKLFKNGRMTRLERDAYFADAKKNGINVIDLSDHDETGDSIVGHALVCNPKEVR